MRAEDVWDELLARGTVSLPDSHAVRPILRKLRRLARRHGYEIAIGYDRVLKQYVIALNPPVIQLPTLPEFRLW